MNNLFIVVQYYSFYVENGAEGVSEVASSGYLAVDFAFNCHELT